MNHRLTFLAGVLVAVLLAASAGPALAGHSGTLLAVDDGSFFYDTDGDCANGGETNDHTTPGATALRHWHVGVPFAGAEAEPLGGYGCSDDPADYGPQTWTVTVDALHVGHLDLTITYTWDQQVPGGGDNDVQVHVQDADGAVVASTFVDEGPKPVVPSVLPVRSHTLDVTLYPGTYTITEDVFSGEHTAWLTELTVSQEAAGGGGY